MSGQAAALSLLLQHLRARKESGQTHVVLSSEGFQHLVRLRGGKPGAVGKSATGGAREQRPGGANAPSGRAPASAGAARFRDLMGEMKAEASSARGEVAPAGGDARLIHVQGASAREKLARLREMAAESPEARALGTLREKMVFATGNPQASLMLIGEAPGYQEELRGEPFVGPAGEKLTQILKAMGLARRDVYISNICKFRPAMPELGSNQGSRNRPPTKAEMDACLPCVLTEIDIVRPRCIVALGATAAAGLGFDGGVGALRGEARRFNEIPLIITYHPSYLLRQEAESADGGKGAKRKVWEDMLAAMDILGMPVSDKQRGFFK
jgi:uracil-DNA glycosylase family 4